MKIKTIKLVYLFNNLTLSLLKLLIVYLISFNYPKNLIRSRSGIRLVIQGNGTQNILNKAFNKDPWKVLVNRV